MNLVRAFCQFVANIVTIHTGGTQFGLLCRHSRTVLIISVALVSSTLNARPPDLSPTDQDKVPPRIIRTCCSFGSKLSMIGLPMVKVTQIISTDELGEHVYLGDRDEGNGIIYTVRGGFIDMGHLRDQADWTAYLFLQIIQMNGQEDVVIEMKKEGGDKNLYLDLSEGISVADARRLAGAIAYDISVWHEIATWFGASSVPLIPERYSSFSIEDSYSNVLGITLGMEALQSDLPFDQAMTNLIASTLQDLGAVQSVEDTYNAMEAVKDVWWTRESKLPTRKVLLQRDIQVYPQVTPWLVPGWQSEEITAIPLQVPRYTLNGINLSDFYRFSIEVNLKFPFKKMFPERRERVITQLDFYVLLQRVEWELANKDRLKGELKTRYDTSSTEHLPKTTGIAVMK